MKEIIYLNDGEKYGKVVGHPINILLSPASSPTLCPLPPLPGREKIKKALNIPQGVGYISKRKRLHNGFWIVCV